MEKKEGQITNKRKGNGFERRSERQSRLRSAYIMRRSRRDGASTHPKPNRTHGHNVVINNQ